MIFWANPLERKQLNPVQVSKRTLKKKLVSKKIDGLKSLKYVSLLQKFCSWGPRTTSVDCKSFLDIYSLRPDPLLSQDLHVNKIPRKCAWSLRNTGLKYTVNSKSVWLFRQANLTFKQCHNFPSFLILFLLFWIICDYSTLDLWIITTGLCGKADALTKGHTHLRKSCHVELTMLPLVGCKPRKQKGRSLSGLDRNDGSELEYTCNIERF